MEKGLKIDTADGSGKTPQQVAEAAKATDTALWIRTYKASKTISVFLSHNLQRIKGIQKHQRIIRNVILIQRVVRGRLVRKVYSDVLISRLEDFQRFNVTWAPSLQLLRGRERDLFGWEAVRALTRDISRETVEKLDDALSKVVLRVGEEEIADICTEQIESAQTEPYVNIEATKDNLNDMKWSNIFQVTSHVVKFLKTGDPLYRSFFVRRMQQLASGDRSRILQKRLKGSQSTIYETYLEQKSGFRILWTEEGNTIVVWFVAKHKSVSRLMRLIDDAQSRSARQQMPETLMEEMRQVQASEKILLDVGNVPLKVYDLSFHELDDITKASWTPQLHLTDEERKVVESDGTVLLLGRSG